MPELEKALLADLDPDFGRLKSYRAAGHMAVPFEVLDPFGSRDFGF